MVSLGLCLLVSLEVGREREQRPRSRKGEKAQEETVAREIRGQRESETREMNDGKVARFGIKRSGKDESTQHGKARETGSIAWLWRGEVMRSYSTHGLSRAERGKAESEGECGCGRAPTMTKESFVPRCAPASAWLTRARETRRHSMVKG